MQGKAIRAFLSGRDVFIKLIVLTGSGKIAHFHCPYSSYTSFRLSPAQGSDVLRAKAAMATYLQISANPYNFHFTITIYRKHCEVLRLGIHTIVTRHSFSVSGVAGHETTPSFHRAMSL